MTGAGERLAALPQYGPSPLLHVWDLDTAIRIASCTATVTHWRKAVFSADRRTMAVAALNDTGGQGIHKILVFELEE